SPILPEMTYRCSAANCCTESAHRASTCGTHCFMPATSTASNQQGLAQANRQADQQVGGPNRGRPLLCVLSQDSVSYSSTSVTAKSASRRESWAPMTLPSS